MISHRGHLQLARHHIRDQAFSLSAYFTNEDESAATVFCMAEIQSISFLALSALTAFPANDVADAVETLHCCCYFGMED